MAQFDEEINHLDSVYEFTCASHQVVSEVSEEKKLLVCERGPLLFIFNFHPSDDYTDLKVRQLPVFGWIGHINRPRTADHYCLRVPNTICLLPTPWSCCRLVLVRAGNIKSFLTVTLSIMVVLGVHLMTPNCSRHLKGCLVNQTRISTIGHIPSLCPAHRAGASLCLPTWTRKICGQGQRSRQR